MILSDIPSFVANEFSSLWKTKLRGESVEIITPYVTTSQKFISVFLTFRDSKYIVSDGGWINEAIYNNDPYTDEDCFRKLLFHYASSFNIKETYLEHRKLYYKVADDLMQVPSIIFDLANFVSAIASATEIEFADTREKETREHFRGVANNFIGSLLPSEKVDFKGYIDNQDKRIKLNAIVKKTPSKIVLINYITGSSMYYFTNSIARTNMMFEMVEDTRFNEYVEHKIALVDSNARGFGNYINGNLSFLADHRKAVNIFWEDKEELAEYLLD